MATTTSAQQLVEGAEVNAQGDLPERYWELLERYRGELVNQAFAILGRLADAEDVAQETFCEAVRQPGKLARARSIGAWLRAINRANALDRRRNRRREEAKAGRKERALPRRPFTTGGFSLLELRDQVAKAIEQLPPKLRAVVVMRYWEHRSYEQIAERLKLAPVTVRRRLYAALVKLYQSGRLKEHVEAPLFQPDGGHPERPAGEKDTPEHGPREDA